MGDASISPAPPHMQPTEEVYVWKEPGPGSDQHEYMHLDGSWRKTAHYFPNRDAAERAISNAWK